MASARKTLAKSLFIMLLENYRNPVSPTVFFRQANIVAVASGWAVRDCGHSNLGLWIFLLAGLGGPNCH